MLDQLKHYKTMVQCTGELIIRESKTRIEAPKTLKISVKVPWGSTLLTEDATNLAEQLNATTHTDFRLSGIAEPATVTADGAAPLYVTVKGTIDGNFEVVSEQDSPIYSSVNAPVTITQDVPNGYKLSAGADLVIGSGEQVFPKYTFCPFFPEYFVTQ